MYNNILQPHPPGRAWGRGDPEVTTSEGQWTWWRPKAWEELELPINPVLATVNLHVIKKKALLVLLGIWIMMYNIDSYTACTVYVVWVWSAHKVSFPFPDQFFTNMNRTHRNLLFLQKRADFVLIVTDFSLWSLNEGFRMKREPPYW